MDPQRNHRHSLTIERVTYESRFFLNEFVCDMFEEDGIRTDGPEMEVLQETESPRELPPEHIIEIKRSIRFIIDAEDEELNRLSSKIPDDMSEEVVMNVTRRLFDDGIFNWGRVIGLLFFAYKACKKILNAHGVLRTLIDSIIDFMRERVIGWIWAHGGWEGLCEFVRRNDRKILFISGSALLVAGGVIVYNKFFR